jgi:hypothetical protein
MIPSFKENLRHEGIIVIGLVHRPTVGFTSPDPPTLFFYQEGNDAEAPQIKLYL